MDAMKPPYGLHFENIPTINLRVEFDAARAFINSAEAELYMNGPVEPIRAGHFYWIGMPEDLFTMLVQRAILGVEAYLPSALAYAAACLGKIDSVFFKNLRNPTSFGAKSMAANIYHRMPASVHEELSLQWLHQHLYEETVAFYRDIRNPIFHGKQIRSEDIAPIREVFKLITKLYAWIDHWHDPDKLVSRDGNLGAIKIVLPKFTNYGKLWGAENSEV